jgi:hypothetical protein
MKSAEVEIEILMRNKSDRKEEEEEGKESRDLQVS